MLQRYLERFAHIIGSWCPSITYVDGFSGPGKNQSEKLSDTSFSIALNELYKARETYAQQGKILRIRCVFLEQDRSRFKELKAFSDSVTDAEVLPLNSSFEEAIPDVIRFVESDRDTFPFVFIDPTGWTGFSMKSISPLLNRRHCEVLISFMLDFIRRFIEQDFSKESFSRLFRSDHFDANLQNLIGLDRDDAIADRYCSSLRDVCGFSYVQRTIVNHPDKDQPDFMLIYGTRHPKGVEVFKSVERLALGAQEKSRAQVESERRRKKEGGQKSFLDPTEMPDSNYHIDLRNRYLAQTRLLVLDAINGGETVAYTNLWTMALSRPLVWKSDLDGWLKEWCDKGLIEWKGHAPSERTFKRDKPHSFSRLARGVS